MSELKFSTISGRRVYYYDSNDPVVSMLKSGILFGASNYRQLDPFIINKGGLLIDCGSHIGTFAVESSKKYKTICVEAAFKNVECLTKTFCENDNVDIIQIAISDKVGKCSFTEPYGPFGMITDSNSCSSDSIESTTLDILLKNRDIAGIKLDIEGGEIDAIKGGIEILSKEKPPMLIEVNGHCLRLRNRSPKDLFEILNEIGYNIYLNLNNSFYKVDKDKIFPFCVQDVLAIHSDNLKFYGNNINQSLVFSDENLIALMYNGYISSNDDCKLYFSTLLKR